jgi:hypothetical protein
VHDLPHPARRYLTPDKSSYNEGSDIVTGEFDTGTPTLQVTVYEDGALVSQVACESADEAAEVAAAWEERPGFRCDIEDLAVRHQPTDVLAPEPEDEL